MSLRVAAGLALWLGLGALPVAHLGITTGSVVALILPLLVLFSPRAGAAALFALLFLPLFVVHPDLISGRTHGTANLLLSAALFLTYLMVALREPHPRVQRPPVRRAGRSVRRSMESLLSAAAAVLCLGALCVPFLPGVAESMRAGYAANPGAAATLLAIGALVLATGLVLVYVAAPLDAAAGRRS